jgi:hypothetical protein
MTPPRPDDELGWDDGPSRPGRRLRRTVIAVIVGLLLLSGPLGLLMLLGTAFPWLGEKKAAYVPSRLTSVLTLKLTIAPDDWPRFVQASDAFAIKYGLADTVAPSARPIGNPQFVTYEGKEAVLSINRSNTEKPMVRTPIWIDIHEIRESGVGPELKAAFEKEVIKAGRFGE